MNACANPEIMAAVDQERTCESQAAGEQERKGRDGRGRFVAGNPGGPGNPFGRRVAELRQAMLDSVGKDDIQAINRKMIEKAREGDAAAAKLVYQYSLGRPAQTVDPDRVDLDEWRLSLATSIPIEVWHALLPHIPAEVVNLFHRIVRERRAQDFWQFIQEGFQAPRPEPEEEAEEDDDDSLLEEDESDLEAAPSVGGENGKRRRPAGGPRKNGAAGRRQSSSSIGAHGESAAPSTTAVNGGAARRRRGAAAYESGARGEPAATSSGCDDPRQWLTTLFARLGEATPRDEARGTDD